MSACWSTNITCRGVPVTFFGRQTMANPLLARLARHFDCPIHGTRVVRLPGHRFRAELTEEIKPARDASGKIDVAGTMQVDHHRDRRLGARTSRAMAVAAPALANVVIGVQRPVLILVHSRFIEPLRLLDRAR